MLRRLSPLVLTVWVALLASLSLVILQNLELRRHVKGLRHQLTLTFERQPGPAPGDLIAIDTEGNLNVATLAQKGEPPTVVFMASGSCPFCRETMEQWRELESRLGTAVRYVLLRLDGQILDGVAAIPSGRFEPLTFSFSDRPDLRWQVPADPTVVAYRLRYVPQTMVARDGEIVFIKTGPLSESDLEQIASSVKPFSNAALETR